MLNDALGPAQTMNSCSLALMSRNEPALYPPDVPRPAL